MFLQEDMSVSEVLLWIIPNRILNILISPGGRGNLARPPGADDELDFDDFDLPYFYIIVGLLYFIIPTLLRYILGHVAPTLLILQLSQQDEAIPEKSEGKERSSEHGSSFRNIRDSFRLIYRVQGINAFLRALFIGGMCLFVTNIVTESLQWALFRYEVLKPFSYALASVLLCDLHMTFTRATISAKPVPILSFQKASGRRQRMKHLAMPAFFYGLTLGLMEQLYDIIVMVIGFDHHEDYTSIRAVAEVFAVMLMLSLRLVALFPTQITLTLAEVKLMSPEIKTIIPSPSKERGLKVGELIGDQTPPAAFEAFSNFFKPLRTVMYLQLIGLHLKKCLLQIIVEIVFITVFFGAMYLELFVPDEDEWIVQFMEALDSYGKLE